MEATRTTIARRLAAPEGPAIVTDDIVVSVCSLDRDPAWPTSGGDIVVTHLDVPDSTRVLLSTSWDGVKGIPAGLAFGPDDALYVADEGHRAMLRVTADLEQTRFITHFRDRPINGPNDLSFDVNGDLYFTDPWTSSPRNPVGAVYGYDWEASELHRIDEGMAFPNGIIVRDGLLYVAETFANTVWRYHLTGPGRAGGREPFCRLPDVPGVDVQGPDGMAFDAQGRLYVTHLASSRVHVFDGDGRAVDAIEVGGTHPTNVCFAGPGRERLLVTVDDAGELQQLDIGVQGDRLNFCPTLSADHPWAALLRDVLDAGAADA